MKFYVLPIKFYFRLMKFYKQENNIKFHLPCMRTIQFYIFGIIMQKVIFSSNAALNELKLMQIYFRYFYWRVPIFFFAERAWRWLLNVRNECGDSLETGSIFSLSPAILEVCKSLMAYFNIFKSNLLHWSCINRMILEVSFLTGLGHFQVNDLSSRSYIWTL